MDSFKFKKVTAVALSAVMMFPCNVLASSISGDIYVGDVISISARDIQVQNNYKSMDEISKEYIKDTEKITSGNTSIDSSDGKLNTGNGNSIIDNLIPDKDLSGMLPNKEKKTLSYDDFMKLIGNQNSEIKKKYETARKNAQKQQDQEKKKGAEAIKKAIEDAQKGINPVTGKKMDSSDSAENPFDMLKASKDELKKWLMGIDDPEVEEPTISAELQKWYNDQMKKMNKKNIENGNQGLVRTWKKLDKSEYSKDTLCYKKDQHNINDIKYKCAKCGKEYGFNKICDCGKYLLSKVHDTANENAGTAISNMGISSVGFASFDEDGTAHSKFVKDIIPMKCKVCGKGFTQSSVDFKNGGKDGFLISSNGDLICKSCSDKILKISEEEWAGNPGSTDGSYGKWIKKYMGDGSYDPKEMLNYWLECKKVKPGSYSSAKDNSNWDIWNPYYDDFITPVIDTSYGEDSIKDGLNADALFEDYLSGLPKDQQAEARKKYEEYKRKKDQEKDKIFNADNSEVLDKILDKYYKLLAAQNTGKGIPQKGKKAETWTEEEKRNFQKAVEEMLNKGTPDSSYWGKNIEKLKDTKDYDKGVNKVFGEWPADRNLWTDKQKEIYEQFKEKYGKSDGMQSALKDMIKDGIFDKDKSYNQIISGIDDYIAGFTSIDESVTVYVTVDSVSGENHTNKKNYTAQGDILLTISSPKNKRIVSDYQITDSLSYRFCPDEAGRYTLHRKIRVYDIEWQIVYQTYNVKVEAELPDGSIAVISEKQITRIKEDKSGLKSSNMRELNAPDITINVKPRTLDIDKKDFYDTERIS